MKFRLVKMYIGVFSFDPPKINDFGWVREEILSFWLLDNGVFFVSRSSKLSGEEGPPFIGLAISDRWSPFCAQAVLPLGEAVVPPQALT